jgi:hypothetical protein
MAAITVLSIQQIGPIYKHSGNRIFPGIAGAGTASGQSAAGCTAGFVYYLDPTTGTYLPVTTATAGKYEWSGFALETVGPGQAVDLMGEGYLGGFDLSALAYNALVFANDAAGVIGTTAGTNTVQVGRVTAMSDKDPATGLPSKVLYVRADMIRNW